MVNIIACCDEFKGTLSAADACKAIEAGARAANETTSVRIIPLTDGGAGFLASLRPALDLNIEELNVVGPFGEMIPSRYGVKESSSLAVVEMALAAGLPMLSEDQKNALRTTSYGVGQLLSHAMTNPKVSTVYVGIGGSCTNDGGIPALQALGLESKIGDEWFGSNSAPLRGEQLRDITQLRLSNGFKELLTSFRDAGKTLALACDVTNPLIGKDGATAIYGPQKGADTPEKQNVLETGLTNVATLAEKLAESEPLLGGKAVDLKNMRGAGGAGGMSGFFKVFLGADWQAGAGLVAKLTNLEEVIAWSDVVISGEGSYDAQTLEYGKTLSVVEQVARKAGKKFVVVCGRHQDAPPPPSQTHDEKAIAEGTAAATASSASASTTGATGVMVLPLTPTYPVKEAMTETASCIAKIVEGNFTRIVGQ